MFPSGFNIIGYASCNIGLGIAARNTMQVLRHAGYNMAVYDIPLAGRSGADTSFTAFGADPSLPPPYGINLFHLNVPQLEHVRSVLHPDLRKNRLNVCVPFWELPRIPDPWLPILDKVDVLLAPSTFIEHAFSCCSASRILKYPQAVFVDDAVHSDRNRFGLPENSFLFVTSFDIGSDLLRKNPLGAIDAFNRAFPDDTDDAALIIKINKTVDTPVFTGLIDKLRGYVTANPNIRIIDSSMSYNEILTLYASCDCYVSLHRAEGLGLGVMESMALGKPVIATYWSGTMDCMTPQNSCMVSCKIVNCDPLFNSTISPQYLGFQGRWAEPDVPEACRWMKMLVRNPDLCRKTGTNARQYMRKRKNEVLEGSVFSMLETVYNNYRTGIYTGWEAVMEDTNGKDTQAFSLYHTQENAAASKELMKRYLSLFAHCKSVLDIGCGPGTLMELLNEQYHAVTLTGIDGDRAMVDRVRAKGLTAHCSDVRDIDSLALGCFDGIYAGHIIEHLSGTDALLFFRSCFFLLNPGGVLLLKTPNWDVPYVRHEGFWLDITHVRPYPARLLNRVLTDTGFVNVRTFAETDGLNDIVALAAKLPR